MKVVKGRGYAILNCDVLEGLAHLPDNSVQCVVTSPPYYGLRAYGTNPQVWDGDPECEHEWGSELPCHYPGQVEQSKWKIAEIAGKGQTAGSGQYCQRCGAWKGELGLEPTPSLYVQHMVQVFREVRRVLRDDGTLWLNIGDSFYGGKGSNGNSKARRTAKERGYQQSGGTVMIDTGPLDIPQEGLKPKDLIGIPWRVAFALQADGWWLRQDIIWQKLNPLPESVEDRCTKAHEYVFLLTKSQKYFYDHEAVKEPAVTSVEAQRIKNKTRHEKRGKGDQEGIYHARGEAAPFSNPRSTRNRRSVWTIPTKPFRGAHFAVMPPDLVEPCVLAGTSEAGCCAQCGAPYKRVIEKTTSFEGGSGRAGRTPDEIEGKWGDKRSGKNILLGPVVSSSTLGWVPTCSCGSEDRSPCIVLDPFNGAATTGLVALQHGRRYLGIELNPEYVEISRTRLENRSEIKEQKTEVDILPEQLILPLE